MTIISNCPPSSFTSARTGRDWTQTWSSIWQSFCSLPSQYITLLSTSCSPIPPTLCSSIPCPESPKVWKTKVDCNIKEIIIVIYKKFLAAQDESETLVLFTKNWWLGLMPFNKIDDQHWSWWYIWSREILFLRVYTFIYKIFKSYNKELISHRKDTN